MINNYYGRVCLLHFFFSFPVYVVMELSFYSFDSCTIHFINWPLFLFINILPNKGLAQNLGLFDYFFVHWLLLLLR